MLTRQNMFTLFSPKKRPLRENSHTAKYLLAFFSKKGSCGEIHTGQKMFYSFFHFFRERHFYVSQIFTSQNQIFHKEKHLFVVTHFLCQSTMEFCLSTIQSCQSTIESCQSTMESSQSTIESSKNTIESSQSTMESSQSTMKSSQSSQSTMKSSSSTMKSSQSTMQDGIGKNTKKIGEFLITWLLYSQNPSRSNMAQPYRLIVWI